MSTKRVVSVALLTLGVAAAIAQIFRAHRAQEVADPSRWRAVTIYRTGEELEVEGQLPQPLADLGDLIEVRIRPAPGNKGTELAVRLRAGDPGGVAADVERLVGSDPRQAVRRALRESKQLLETGEIILLNPKPEGHRKSTPGGAIVDLLTKRSMGEGVL